MFKSEKLNQLLAAVTPEQKQECFNGEIFLEDFDLSLCDGVFDYTGFSNRVYTAPLIGWRCTDTEVGVYAYYLDDELIALSFQEARKSDTHLVWVNAELREVMREFILSLYSPAVELDPFSTIDQVVTDEIIQSYQTTKIEQEELQKKYGW